MYVLKKGELESLFVTSYDLLCSSLKTKLKLVNSRKNNEEVENTFFFSKRNLKGKENALDSEFKSDKKF